MGHEEKLWRSLKTNRQIDRQSDAVVVVHTKTEITVIADSYNVCVQTDRPRVVVCRERQTDRQRQAVMARTDSLSEAEERRVLRSRW